MKAIYPYKLLFVEDEDILREYYTIYLKGFFSEVYEACDGEKAYELYKTKKPDIMIVDITIPKLNGIELLKKIRQNDYVTKIIILSAHTDKAFLLDAASLQLTKYLVKPISRKDLQEALEFAIEALSNYTILPIKKIDLPQSFSWNIELKELSQNGNVIELTNKERSLLTLLFSQRNRIFTYNEIFEYVWENEESVSYNGLKNLIKRLRKKMPENTIVNLFNEGYKINF